MRKFLLSGVALLASFGVANATVSILASGTGSASSTTAAPAGTGTPTAFGPAGFNGPLGAPSGGPVGGWTGGLITFVTQLGGGPVTITVRDCCLVGDVFQVAVDGGAAFQGQSPGVPLGGTPNSVGVFSVSGIDDGGPHTLGIEDILLSYMGNPSPFGGTNPITSGPDVSEDYNPAGMSFLITQGSPGPVVPEPMSLAMLGVGLVGLGAAKWRGKK